MINSKGRVLANVKDTYTSETEGIHPSKAKEHHLAVKDKVVNDALKTANIELTDIDLISFSQGPGLPPCLLVGMQKAKELAKKLNVSLVGVNHCISHLEIGKLLTKAKYPVLLYTSGANTQIIAYEGGKYRIFGETLDQGVGNFIDAFARYIGLGFPGGPKIEQLGLKSRSYIELPYVVKGMDVSFSGLLTNLKQKHDSLENQRFSGPRNREKRSFSGPENSKGIFSEFKEFSRAGRFTKEDLAYSLQETIFAMLVEVAERAMAHCNKNELLLGGGVACNKRLQEMCRIMCEARNAKFFAPENQFLVDNGLMIAWQGILQRKHGTKDYASIDIKPYQRTDDVEVTWY